MDKRSDKRVVQDIIASNRRSMRIAPPRQVEVYEEEPEEKVPLRKIRSDNSVRFSSSPRISQGRPRRKILSMLTTFFVVFVGIAVIAVAFSLLYSKGVITITPKTAHFNIEGTPLTIKKINDSSFGYDVVTVVETLSQTVPATKGPLIETKARGAITLYNAQSIQQKIVAGTRLSRESSSSHDSVLIYRTTTTVVIPPARADKTAGSIPVSVLADQAGDSYNMPKNDGGDFKVVAYKGGPKYTTVYGKFKTSFSGGFSGNKEIISSDTQKAAIQSIEDSLKTKLGNEVKTLVQKDSILYDGAYNIEYEVSDPVPKDGQTALISIKGTLFGAKLNKNNLLKFIANKALDKFPAPTYDIAGLETLKFTLINAKDFSVKKETPLIFNLKGTVSLTGTLSETALKNELKGTHLKDSKTIFNHYPAIGTAYARIYPFWMRSFPNSVDKIVIEMKN